MQLDTKLDLSLISRVPLLVWGPPGAGKTATIRAWAERRKLRSWTVVASLREPADFGGLPIVDHDGRLAGNEPTGPRVTFAPPRFAVEAAAEGGVIFLDELTTAPPAVQAALLRAVVDRAFGDLELDPSRVAIVAAANPPSDAAGGWDLAPPLANRFAHVRFELSPNDWTEAFPGYWGCPPALTFDGRAVDQRRWGRARSLVAAFLRARPSLLLQLPADVSQRGEAWPSPRTWDYASRLIAAAEQRRVGLTDVLPLLAGCVGEGPAMELAAWARDLDLPDPEELLADPARYRHPDRGDQAYAVISAVCQAAIGDLTPERWLAAWTVLASAASAGSPDVAAAAARALARERRDGLPLPTRQITPFLPVLEAAGLLRAG
jgi:hypothetical protein